MQTMKGASRFMFITLRRKQSRVIYGCMQSCQRKRGLIVVQAKEKDKKRRHEKVLSKTATLFDLEFKHTAAAEHQTEQKTTPSSDGNM